MPVPNLNRSKVEVEPLKNTDTNFSGNSTDDGPFKTPSNGTMLALNDTAAVFNETLNSTRQAKRSRRPDDIVSLQKRPQRSTKAQVKVLSLDEKRGTCPQGKAFYKCGNGFTGCCSQDPCSGEGKCPDGSGKTTKSSSTKAKSSTTKSSSKTKSTASPSPTTTSNTSSPAQSGSSSTKSPPACPKANNSLFKDGSGITYRISCDSDNTFSSSSTFSVDTGGYSQCFNACSKTSSCAGFVFNGRDSGTCSLKGQLPRSKYAVKENSDFVSCAKLNPKASSGSGSNKKPSTGVLAGAIVGALFAIALLAFLIVCLIKRKKKKEVERQAIILNNIQTPVETAQISGGGHQRQVSTSHDVFGPYGGYYRGSQEDPFQRNEPRSSERAGQSLDSTTYRQQADIGSARSPSSRYSRPDSNHIPIMLDRSPTGGYQNSSPSPRSPRFYEHLRDLDDNWSGNTASPRYAASSVVSDSPTLGRPPIISPSIGTAPAPTDPYTLPSGRYEQQTAGHEAWQTSKSPPATRSDKQRSFDSAYQPGGVSSFDMIGERFYR